MLGRFAREFSIGQGVQQPSLALDSAGNPRVGYDVELWWGGTSPYIQCNIAVPVARFGLFFPLSEVDYAGDRLL